MLSFLQVAQLVDSAFPTGAFSHSFGLETYVQEERIRTIPDFLAWMDSYIRGTVTPIEGTGVYWSAIWVPAYLQQSEQREQEAIKAKLLDLSRRMTGTRLARESREGASKIGKRYLHTVQAVYPEAQLGDYAAWIKHERGDANAAIVHGWICAYLQLTPHMAVLSFLYQTVNSMLQNLIRMWSLGQTDGQKIMTALFPLLEREAAAITGEPLLPSEMYTANVMQEIAAMRHESLYSRLFMS
ncbi:urease accessory protein [Paenibacillus algorifonticola]|uniref:Urease accessory protein UreF n=1 Tax=Paenibacillus algorifonticola TaxID=684063 RepID=A0A1I2ACJ7_9BACL|nr:urease accessory UreF family protein [Paenibacillus algorifonticola]SFE40550.1 urease accessory protein [Paenibacillus algorifonticola]